MGALIVGEPIEFVDYAATSIIFIGVFLLKRGSARTSPASSKTSDPIIRGLKRGE
ncbi:hypothetical protein [Desulfopila sp. IMCC35006]|uniref:hypothetical protein n=1 Tax=Desulfopila sp. IMCC35006 TaxID=2569542 RepID=UPI00351A014A